MMVDTVPANHFPLYLFFERLNRAGIVVSIRDYRRISRVLATDGNWTLQRLERVLGNLLVHDRDERLLFQHEFRTFFAAPEGESVAVDVQQWRDEMARLLAEEPPSATAPLPSVGACPASDSFSGKEAGESLAGQAPTKPVRTVTVPAFEMGAYEVTVGQFKAFAEATQYQTTAEKDGSCVSYDASGKWGDVKGNSWQQTGYTQNEDSPVTCVSWDDAQAYLQWLSEQTKQVWRLPTEAEWEYAARGGTKTTYSWGDQPPICDTQAPNGAQFGDCTEQAPLKVGSFKPNPIGLYDVHGNAWEWVEDCYKGDYKDAPVDGSARQGCDAAASRVLRGGSWSYTPQWLRSAARGDSSPVNRDFDVGFRAARTN